MPNIKNKRNINNLLKKKYNEKEKLAVISDTAVKICEIAAELKQERELPRKYTQR